MSLVIFGLCAIGAALGLGFAVACFITGLAVAGMLLELVLLVCVELARGVRWLLLLPVKLVRIIIRKVTQ